MHPCIGYSNERIEIFFAKGLQKDSRQKLDHGEFIDLLTMTLDEALLAVRDGKITDGKSIAALFWADKIICADW